MDNIKWSMHWKQKVIRPGSLQICLNYGTKQSTPFSTNPVWNSRELAANPGIFLRNFVHVESVSSILQSPSWIFYTMDSPVKRTPRAGPCSFQYFLLTLYRWTGAASWDDRMFVVKFYCKIQKSFWALTLTEPVPEAFELPASGWPKKMISRSYSKLSPWVSEDEMAPAILHSPSLIL